MHVPFTAAQFIHVFATYNAAIWPTQIVAYVLGITMVAGALLRPGRLTDLTASLGLAAMWAFTGLGYHLLSFSAINPAARLFGALFLVQAVLLAIAGLRGTLRFRFERHVRNWMGLVFITHSMLLYPLIGYLSGHGFPNGPTFGVTPCPLTIFTFGLLLLTELPPKHLVVLPFAWALVGSTAATSLGIREDVSLLIIGCMGTARVMMVHAARAMASRRERIRTRALTQS